MAFLITVASSALLAACASNRADTAAVSSHPPIVVDSYHTPSAAEIYAQRYQSTATQIRAGGNHRFVTCEDACAGATLKTPVATFSASVARRAQQNLRASKAKIAAMALEGSDEQLTASADSRGSRDQHDNVDDGSQR
jgi:hypothetical protein